jgi:ubiquitin related modifier 1
MGFNVIVEFLGGLDALFGTIRQEILLVEEGEGLPITMRTLLKVMRARYIRDRPEHFFANNNASASDAFGVRPGILVLVNEVDWELEGKLDCQLTSGTIVAFISTLHGG